ncbi:FliH/SctL family protein [Priestia aryabhattai]
MSFSNSRIIKNLHRQEGAVHIDEHLASFQDEYYIKTSKKRLEELQKELDAYRQSELQKINDEAAIIRDDAYKKGKETALEETRPEVEEMVKNELLTEFERVADLYNQANLYLIEQKEKLSDKKKDWLQENEKDLVDILISSVEKILCNKVQLQVEDVKQIIQESINEVNDKSRTVWIRVNPEVKHKIDSQKWNDRNIEWIADPKLSYLDVMVETELEWIDSTINNKIENLKKTIEEWVQNNDLLRES